MKNLIKALEAQLRLGVEDPQIKDLLVASTQTLQLLDNRIGSVNGWLTVYDHQHKHVSIDRYTALDLTKIDARFKQ